MSDVIPVITVGPDKPDNVYFGELLKHHRVKFPLTRSEAAQRIGISSEYLRLIERGERTPALGMFPKMLDIYDVPYTINIGTSEITFDNIQVNFISRVKVARGYNHPYKFPNLTRNDLISEIVKLLVAADDATLKKIHRKLIRSSN